MKKSFIAGMVILLPLALTVVVILFVINLLTDPFVDAVQSTMRYYGLLDKGFFFLSAEHLQLIVSQALILAFLFVFTVFVGIVGRWFFVHYLIKLWDSLLHKIPFIRAVYKTCQDMINTIVAAETKSFKQVVVAPFPNPETHSIGLVTREHVQGIGNKTGEHLVAVFVPTTPNPTSGYLILYEKKDLIYLDTTVEEAMKYIISCGVILKEPFKVMEEKKL